MNIFKKAIIYVLAIMMGAMTILTFYQIVLRYVFNSPSSWSEEAVRFIFVYCSFIAGGIGIMEHAHIGVDIVVNLLPIHLRKISSIIVHSCIAIFGGVLIYISIPLLKITQRQLSSALRIPMHYIYFSVVLFGILCIFFSIYEIWESVRKRKILPETA